MGERSNFRTQLHENLAAAQVLFKHAIAGCVNDNAACDAGSSSAESSALYPKMIDVVLFSEDCLETKWGILECIAHLKEMRFGYADHDTTIPTNYLTPEVMVIMHLGIGAFDGWKAMHIEKLIGTALQGSGP